MKKWGSGILVAFTLFVGWVLFIKEQKKSPAMKPVSLVMQNLRDADTAGYPKVLKQRIFEFPKDHGPHPEYRTEWWYFTGNLATETGRNFGYQFTLFRNATAPQPKKSSSQWATNQMVLGHFTLTDVENKKFHSFERLSRAAIGLAGFQASPFKIWIDDWEASSVGAPFLPLKIEAEEQGIKVKLVLEFAKKLTLQGDQGLSIKGHTHGNASYYYSITRLKTRGIVHIGNQEYAISGLSWMDREWSSGVLDKEHVGWDWFSIQMKNGWDLMAYLIRREGGDPDTTSFANLISPKGESIPLQSDQFTVNATDHWKSPITKIRYPSQWNLKIPSQNLELTVVPKIANQEHTKSSILYWEGAIEANGSFQNEAVQGSGYAELVGYE